MCGICGIWGEPGERRVGEMVRAMDHRGPDDRGTFSDSQISLGMARLAIIDVTAGGHQPMSTPGGLIHIVYNGETYNYLSERERLQARGHTFASTSDTEVVLRMYEEYGDAFVQRLRGMFALAIYDRRRGPGRERLLLARDHFGIKPLLYAELGNQLVFASEIKAMLASGLIRPEIDPLGLRYLLTYGSVYQPHTILKGVKMLPPAHTLLLNKDGMRIERFWSLGVDRLPDLGAIPYEAAVSEMDDILSESVRLQMISDVPLGAFLSGGIDSSLMVAMMSKASTEKVKTYAVGFGAEGREMDETDDAALTAQFIGTDHTRVTVTGTDVRRDIEHIALGLDQPSVDGVNTYYVARAARTGVTVAISGNGGDELFAGYPWFIFMKNDQERRQRSAVK
ncbi:MAG: asparagine synthase (glutamine-hydrolyzing), partial [Pyrinomonadaceae bacterium]